MATFDFRSLRDGVNFIVVSDDRKSGVGTELSRAEVERNVRDLCRAAGLPEPWKRS